MRISELVNFNKLAHHRAIGWDIDKTLIGDPASVNLQQFIKEHPEIQHYVITYRTHGLVSSVFPDIEQYRILTKRNFSGIFHIDQQLWMDFKNIQYQREIGKFNGSETEIEKAYHDWKPAVCSQHHITALVDDRVQSLRGPCIKYHVELFDPVDFR